MTPAPRTDQEDRYFAEATAADLFQLIVTHGARLAPPQTQKNRSSARTYPYRTSAGSRRPTLEGTS